MICKKIFSEFYDILERFERKRRNWPFQSVMLYKQTQLIILLVLKIALVNSCFSDKNMIILLSMVFLDKRLHCKCRYKINAIF